MDGMIVKQTRLACNMTQKEFAGLIGCTRELVAKWENSGEIGKKWHDAIRGAADQASFIPTISDKRKMAKIIALYKSLSKEMQLLLQSRLTK